MSQGVRVGVGAASAVLVGAMVATWILVDLETAGGVASVVGAVVGVAGLAYALMGGEGVARPQVTRTGRAEATGGGQANSGIRAPGDASTGASVQDTGDAIAQGPGSTANTGIMQA